MAGVLEEPERGRSSKAAKCVLNSPASPRTGLIRSLGSFLPATAKKPKAAANQPSPSHAAWPPHDTTHLQSTQSSRTLNINARGAEQTPKRKKKRTTSSIPVMHLSPLYVSVSLSISKLSVLTLNRTIGQHQASRCPRHSQPKDEEIPCRSVFAPPKHTPVILRGPHSGRPRGSRVFQGPMGEP